jgi:hypothetical protein
LFCLKENDYVYDERRFSPIESSFADYANANP